MQQIGETGIYVGTKGNRPDLIIMDDFGETGIYVGTKEEYLTAINRGMKIVCALNRASGFVSHQSVVGWSGRGCDKEHPDYLYKLEPDAIYLKRRI